MIISWVAGRIPLPDSRQLLHYQGEICVCFANKATGFEGVALLIYGDLLFPQKSPISSVFPTCPFKMDKMDKQMDKFLFVCFRLFH